MIDLIYKTLLTIINKDNQGYVSPEEFNILLYQVVMEIFRSYFGDENRDKNRMKNNMVGRGYANLPFNERQRITQFAAYTLLTAPASPNPWSTFTLPEDLYFIEQDGISTPAGKVFDEVERNSVARMLGTEVAPTELYPIYEDYGDIIWTYPNSIKTINLRYIRTPKQPKWTYITLGDSELFNPAAPDFQDVELHESEFSNIVVRLLTHFGINLREAEVVQIAETLKDKQNIKDNN